jgi:hypothetical protein
MRLYWPEEHHPEIDGRGRRYRRHRPKLHCNAQQQRTMALDKPYADVPGTTIFDAEQAQKATT